MVINWLLVLFSILLLELSLLLFIGLFLGRLKVFFLSLVAHAPLGQTRVLLDTYNNAEDVVKRLVLGIRDGLHQLGESLASVSLLQALIHVLILSVRDVRERILQQLFMLLFYYQLLD